METTPEHVRQLLQSEDLGDRLTAINQARDLDPAVTYELLQVGAADTNPRVRYAAISQFSSVGDQDREQSLALLRQCLLTDKEVDVQAAAADALAALKLTDAFDDLRRIYETTTEWLLQFSIVAALGEMGDNRAFPLLEDALGSGNELIRTAAIGSFGELGDERAVPILLPYVTHPDWQIRHRVAQALGRFQTPEAQEALQRLSQDMVEVVAQTARIHQPS